MIHWNKTKLIKKYGQSHTHVWVVCDACDNGRWVHRSDVLRGKNSGTTCRACSNRLSWDGRRINLADGWRKCKKCLQGKALSEFSKDKRKRGGIRSYCKECQRDDIRQRRAENPEATKTMRRIYQANRRARIKHGSDGTVTADEWKRLLDQYDQKCLCCGSHSDLQPDHVVPLSKGGKHSIDNIQPLCGKCNRLKQSEVIDYRESRGTST